MSLGPTDSAMTNAMMTARLAYCTVCDDRLTDEPLRTRFNGRLSWESLRCMPTTPSSAPEGGRVNILYDPQF